MSGKQAKVTSVEAMEKFHSAMLEFSQEALTCLDKVRCEVVRRQQMVEHQLPARWNAELSKWRQKLKDAQKEIRYSSTSVGRLEAEQTARISKQKIRCAEEKLEALKKWNMRLPLELPEAQSRLLKLKTFLVNDFDKATSLLNKHADKLRQYTEINKGGS